MPLAFTVKANTHYPCSRVGGTFTAR